MLTKDEHILICAVRYALGRMSYMVDMVCEYITNKLPELSDSCIRVIIYDIEEDIKMYHNIGRTCGMKCDERTWLKLLERLREEHERREQAQERS
mgnify:CR=1 FL=1